MIYDAIAPSTYEQNYNLPAIAPPFYEQTPKFVPPVYGQNKSLANYYGPSQVIPAVPVSAVPGGTFERGAFYGNGPVLVPGETFERRSFYGNGGPGYPVAERFGAPAYPRQVEVPRAVPFNNYQGF